MASSNTGYATTGKPSALRQQHHITQYLDFPGKIILAVVDPKDITCWANQRIHSQLSLSLSGIKVDKHRDFPKAASVLKCVTNPVHKPEYCIKAPQAFLRGFYIEIK